MDIAPVFWNFLGVNIKLITQGIERNHRREDQEAKEKQPKKDPSYI